MRSQFIIFLSVAIALWALINFQVYRSLRGLFAAGGSGRVILLVAIIITASLFLIGRFMERTGGNGISGYLVVLGSWHMALVINLFICGIIADSVLLCARLVSVYHGPASGVVESVARLSPYAVAAVALILVIAGAVNARLPWHAVLNLEINRPGMKPGSLRIAAITDVHLGHIVKNGELDRLVKSVNALKPDIIVFGGDLIDEDLKPVIDHDLGAHLKELAAPLGIYAVYGNHEYIGGAIPAAQYLTAHNIRIIRDEAVLINNAFYLVGRDDRSSARFGGTPRAGVNTIVAGIDRSKPVIFLDHQPYDLHEAEQAGIDLQISGHTHHGQIWPFNLITGLIYEVSSGYKRKGNTHIYVSNGYGTWGPPVRLGNRPEFVEINLRW